MLYEDVLNCGVREIYLTLNGVISHLNMLTILVILYTIPFSNPALWCTDIKGTLFITNPTGNSITVYEGTGPITVTCEGIAPIKNATIHWMRNDSTGVVVTVKPQIPLYTKMLSTWSDTYADNEAPMLKDFPYTYHCVVKHPCFTTLRSPAQTFTNIVPRTALPPPTSPACPEFDTAMLKTTFQHINVTYVLLKWEHVLRPGDVGFKLKYWYKPDGSANKTEYNKVFNATRRRYTMKNLVPDTVYEININVITQGGLCLSFPSYDTFTTQKADCNASDFRNFSLNVSVDSKMALLHWFYDQQDGDDFFRLHWGEKKEIPKLVQLDINETEHYLKNLIPFTDYVVNLHIFTKLKCRTKSNKIEFRTLEDEPSAPREVTAEAVGSNSIMVTWIEPEFPNGEDLYYELRYRSVAEKESEMVDVHDELSYEITELDGGHIYEIVVQAINSFAPGGTSEPVRVFVNGGDINNTPPIPATAASHGSNVGTIVGVIVGLVLLVLLIILLCLLRRRKIKKQNRKSLERFHEMHGVANEVAGREERIPSLPTPDQGKLKDIDAGAELSYIVLIDDWEILRENLTVLDKKLGGGQFGLVKQGLYTVGNKEPEVVAVKMLKDNASENDRKDLLTEIKILKDVNQEQHPNVLRLIGCCTSSAPIYLVTEFCPGGSLRKFLRNSRVETDNKIEGTYINLSSTLTHRQLLKIAVDVASGMMHLESYKFVHRDLAARNVLIGDEDNAKVSDFGLARDMGQDEEYVRANQNLLPVKWMAIESLLYGRFLTASDVWSYGVLLYEITTLGEEPYKGISPHNIVSHVGSGCRMEKPAHCSDEIYSIMLKCWKVEPEERPTFEELHKTIREMLLDEEKIYINVKQTLNEGSLDTNSKNASFKDNSVRYTSTPVERTES